MSELRKCPSCETYTLKEVCPKCKTPTKDPKPPRFSPEDKYGKYRRLAKKAQSD